MITHNRSKWRRILPEFLKNSLRITARRAESSTMDFQAPLLHSDAQLSGQIGSAGHRRVEDVQQNVNASKHLIDLYQVTKSFQTAAGEFTALKHVNLQVDGGKFVAVIGKSGSGKSTLLNMITGIDRPTTGEVWVAGSPLHTLTEEEIAVWRGQKIGVIFQFFQLLPTLTAVENILLAMDYGQHYPVEERAERALALLELVGMAEQAHQLPSALSGGEQQCIAIARALANEPPLLTADEPTGNLDSRTAEMILRLFEALVGRGKTILMVTHDMDLAERAQHIITLADGEIVNG